VGAHPLRAPHRRDLVRRAAPLPALLPLALALSPAPRAVPFPATPSLLLPPYWAHSAAVRSVGCVCAAEPGPAAVPGDLGISRKDEASPVAAPAWLGALPPHVHPYSLSHSPTLPRRSGGCGHLPDHAVVVSVPPHHDVLCCVVSGQAVAMWPHHQRAFLVRSNPSPPPCARAAHCRTWTPGTTASSTSISLVVRKLSLFSPVLSIIPCIPPSVPAVMTCWPYGA
jgi:hypothetical protein